MTDQGPQNSVEGSKQPDVTPPTTPLPAPPTTPLPAPPASQPQAMPPPQGMAISNDPFAGLQRCVVCGKTTLALQEITPRRRPKFGCLWWVLTVLTAGIALIVWLVWPRHEEDISVDRFVQCTSCGARQP